jgi:8-oxo-dGTP diphosphatase
MTNTEPQVRVGTGIIVVRDKKVLVGRRKGSHAAGLISFPGGHLDFGETWQECAFRELKEECGSTFQVALVPMLTEVPNDHVTGHGRIHYDWFVTNDILKEEGKHYITIFLVAEWVKGEPVNMEPNKCEGWEWFTFEELKALGDKAAQWIPINDIEMFRHKIGF